MEAAAIPFPRPDKTPPVTMIYLVGISIDDLKEAIFEEKLSGFRRLVKI